MNGPEVYEEERPFDVREVLNKFLRRRSLFLCVAVPILLFVLISQFTKPYKPLYRATFDVGVLNERLVEGMFSGSREAPTMQIGVVTQRVISNLLSVNLAERVVDNISLCAFLQNGSSDLMVEAKLKEDLDHPIGPLYLKLHDGKYALYSKDEKLGEGSFGSYWVYEDGTKREQGHLNEYHDFGKFELRVTPLRAIQDGKTYELTIYPKRTTALALRNSLSITVLEADKIEQMAGSSGLPSSGEHAKKKLVNAKSLFPGMNLIGMLRIDVHWGNREDALKIAQALSQQIITEDKGEKSKQYIQSKAFIDSMLTFYHNKLTGFEENIKDFKERKKIANLAASTQALITQISELESIRSQLQIERTILDDLSSYLVRRPGTSSDLAYTTTLMSDPALQNIYSELLNTEAELRAALKEYSSGHPKAMQISARLDGLKEQLKEESAKRLSTISTEVTSVSRQISVLQQRLDKVPAEEIQLARLGRDRETAEKLYTFFAEKLEETRVQEAGVTSDLKIINPPLVSSGPVNSKGTLRHLITAFVLSILGGGFAVFAADYLDRSIKDPDAVKNKLGLPVYGTVPFIEDADDRGKNRGIADKVGLRQLIVKLRGNKQKGQRSGFPRLVSEDLSSPEFEAFRKLIINLDTDGSGEGKQVVYVTSPGPEEGKTFVTLNLAVALAASGKLVIVVDTDFRKKGGQLSDIVKVRGKYGIFDILREKAALGDIIIPLDAPAGLRSQRSAARARGGAKDLSTTSPLNVLVDLLPIGRIPSNPFALLESAEMRRMIAVLKGTYDYVLIDGVPILLFADAAYLAAFSDSILLIARYGKTGFKEMVLSRDILRASKTDNIGLVMNAVPRDRGSYYYSYYFKYYSKYNKRGKA